MTYIATDKARFTYDSADLGTGWARDPMRYVADAFRHCERTDYTVAEYIADAIEKWGNSANAAYWGKVLKAYGFFIAHPNARQVVKALRRNAPRSWSAHSNVVLNYMVEAGNTASHISDLLQRPELASPAAKAAARRNIASVRAYRLNRSVTF